MKVRFALLIIILFVYQNIQAERFIPKSDLISKVLKIVNNLYVDRNRVIPAKMLKGSLERLSTNIAPVLTKLELRDSKVIIDVSVDQYSSSFTFKSPEEVDELNNILQHAVRFVKQHLVKDEKPEFVDYAVINGFLKQLDPHSSLLIPEMYSSFSTSTSGNFGGVGMMIGIREGSLTIIAPIDNTPASRAGLRSKDKIVQINEESTINMSLTDAVKKLRGKAGTKVEIFIMRKGFTAARKYSITRDIIKITSVESFIFKEGEKRVGMLKINAFQQNTIDEINSHLDKLDYDLNDFQGLIIDLRNNPGGLLDQSIKVSDRFLSDGVIVSTAGLNPDSIKTFKAHWFRSIMDIPIMVLVNNGSASASEIVTAALKKNKRAVVIGLQTFGKGSVQQVIPFKQGSALRLTTSKYLTPGNISIQSVGVTPHILLEPYYVSNDFLHVTSPVLKNAENSLDQNFAEWGDKAEQPEMSVFYLYKEKEDDASDDADDEETAHKEMKLKRLKKDFLVQTAVKILIKNEKKDFNHLLASSLEYAKQIEKDQEEELINKFARFDIPIDWKKYQTSGESKITSRAWLKIKKTSDGKVVWENHSGPIKADNEIRLYLEVKNIGQAKISRIMAITECQNPVFSNRQFAFGKIDAGESKFWFIPIKISESAFSRNNLINFSFFDQQKRKIHKDSIVLNIVEKKRPEFQYDISLLDNGEQQSVGNSDGMIQNNETIVVRVDVTNKGQGQSGPLTILLKNGEGRNIFLKKGRQSIEALSTGETKTAFFQFDMKKEPEDNDIDFSLDILDKTYPFSSINQKIKFPLHKKVSTISNMSPVIRMDSEESISSKRIYKLSGKILDDMGVKDVYVFNNEKKIFYKNFLDLKQRNKVNFDLDINLESEGNKVLIITRDDKNVIARKRIYLRYFQSK